MEFTEWVKETMETRLIVRAQLDPRPRKNEFRALLVGCGHHPHTGKVGGAVFVHVNTEQRLDYFHLQAECAWQEVIDFDALFRQDDWRVQDEYVFKFKKQRGQHVFPGYLPLCHDYVIDNLACIRGILMGAEETMAYTLPENYALLRNMIRQLQAMTNEAYALAYGNL